MCVCVHVCTHAHTKMATNLARFDVRIDAYVRMWYVCTHARGFLSSPLPYTLPQVSEGDVIEVDTVLRSAEESDSGEGERGPLVKRGRVEVLEIGERTRRGGYHLTLLRYKHYSQFHRAQSED